MRPRFIIFLLASLLAGLSALPRPALAADEAPLAIELNTQPRGTLVALLGPDDEILMLVTDFEALGMIVTNDLAIVIDGQKYISLSAIEGLSSHLNLATLTGLRKAVFFALGRYLIKNFIPAGWS